MLYPTSHLPTQPSIPIFLVPLIFLLSLPSMSDSVSYSDDSDELAPSKVLEECIAEQRVLDSFAQSLAMKIKAAFSARVHQRQYGPRKSIRRDHGGVH